ncbi:macrolide-specific efflux protein [[Actinobacillus] rossii]|uniref:Macrolide-specific efflux protein n=1 Tax=[Actinobacillus] rossii TaxID=123820 RepID=A0A380U368_9PAST|nr:macrolide-specific efflux protein [[Actinobacillus] rossii]
MRKLVLLLILSNVFLTACQEQDDTHSEIPLMKVNVVHPQTMEFTRTLTLSGSWVAKEDVAIGTALQGLQILSVEVEAGSAVTKGQVLATLEHSNVQSQLLQNNAQLARAKANLVAQETTLNEAETNLKRYQALATADAISRQELEQQRAKVATAKANKQSAKAEIEQIQAQVNDSRHQRNKAEIISPANGIITKRNAETGALTDANALFHLAKNGEIELEVEANTNEIILLKQGLSAKLKTLTHKQKNGQVRLVFPEIDPKTRLGKARIAFVNSQMPIGSYSEVDIALPKQKVTHAVPLSAISFNVDGRTSVLVVNIEGKVERRFITLGSQYQDWVEVVSGLSVTDKIVKQAAAFVSDGDVVESQLIQG